MTVQSIMTAKPLTLPSDDENDGIIGVLSYWGGLAAIANRK